MNSSCRKRIKKSTEGWLKYGILNTYQYEQFYQKLGRTEHLL
jgi:hypothetical protein